MRALHVRRLLAAAALVATAGCSTFSSARHEGRLRDALDATLLPVPLEQAWPQALKTAAARGFALLGRDREAAGQGAQGDLNRLMSKGFETIATRSGGRLAETDEDGDHVRLRLEGYDRGAGKSQVRIYRVTRGVDSQHDEAVRDFDAELDVLRAIDPDAAAKVMERAGERG